MWPPSAEVLSTMASRPFPAAGFRGQQPSPAHERAPPNAKSRYGGLLAPLASAGRLGGAERGGMPFNFANGKPKPRPRPSRSAAFGAPWLREQHPATTSALEYSTRGDYDRAHPAGLHPAARRRMLQGDEDGVVHVDLRRGQRGRRGE